MVDMIACDGPFCPFIHVADDLPRRRPWLSRGRRLAHYLLVTSLHGTEEVLVDGEAVTIPAGGSYLIQPDALHDLSSPGNQPVWIHFDLVWDPRRREHPHAGPHESELGRRASFLQPGSEAVWGVDLPVAVPAALRALFADAVPRLVATWKRGDRLSGLAATHQLSGLLLSWVEHAWRGRDGGAGLDPQTRLARAEAMAMRSLDTGFGVDEFAAAAGYSRSRFCSVFTAQRGLSPGTWLRRERLRLAEMLLSRAELGVAEVGAMIGYPDPTVFGRVFRSHAGVSPSAWRARQARR